VDNMQTLDAGHLEKALNLLLDETFGQVHGIYLDRGTSLFETLATISAEEASVPVGDRCATLAAQVKHIAFYLDVVVKATQDPNKTPADWDMIWRTVSTVDEKGWEEIKEYLRVAYDGVKLWITEKPAWESERQIGEAIAIIAHTAYHLGEIRQALCTLKQG